MSGDGKWRPTLNRAAELGVLPTPRVSNGAICSEESPSEAVRNSPSLAWVVANCVMPTLTVNDSKNDGGGSQQDRRTLALNTLAIMGSLPTPTVSRGRNATDEAGWAKVKANDGKCREGNGAERHSGTTLHDVAYSLGETSLTPSSDHEESRQKGGKLNPAFCEWMQGFPLGWTVCAPLGILSCPSWLRVHSLCCSLSSSETETNE